MSAGELKIGGLTLQCDGGFVESISSRTPRKESQRERKSQKRSRTRNREEENAVLEDYFENLLENGEQILNPEQRKRHKRMQHGDGNSFRFLHAKTGFDGPKVEELMGPGESFSDSSSLADSEDNDKDSEGPSISDVAEDLNVRLLLQSQASLLSAANCSPPSFSQGRSSLRRQRSRKRSSGDLLAESLSAGSVQSASPKLSKAARKKQLQKRQKLLEKKAAKAELRDLDLQLVNRQLHDFVTHERDMEAFPPMAKASRSYVQRLAALYGLNATQRTVEGGKKFVMLEEMKKCAHPVQVHTTRRSRLPEQEVSSQVAALLEDFRIKSSPPSQKPARTGSGSKRQGGGRKWRDSGGAAGSGADPKFRQPVQFICGGHLNDAEPDHIVTMNAMQLLRQQKPEDTQGSPNASQATDAPEVGPSLSQHADVPAGGAPSGALQLWPLSASQLPSEVAKDSPESEHWRPPAAGLGFGAALEEELAQRLVFSDPTPGCQDDDPEAVERPEAKEVAEAGQLVRRELPLFSVFEDRTPCPVDESAGTIDQQHYLELLEEKCQPSVLLTKKQCKQARKKLEKEQRRAARRDGLERDTRPAQTANAYGEFEKHTRGIGSKLLARMGFAGQGTGLGRDKQGIAEPLKAVARPRQLGLGAE